MSNYKSPPKNKEELMKMLASLSPATRKELLEASIRRRMDKQAKQRPNVEEMAEAAVKQQDKQARK